MYYFILKIRYNYIKLWETLLTFILTLPVILNIDLTIYNLKTVMLNT